MSTVALCQGTKWRRNIAENFNRLSRAHERYRQTHRQTTDGRATAYSERERKFTFDKNYYRVHDSVYGENKNVTIKYGEGFTEKKCRYIASN